MPRVYVPKAGSAADQILELLKTEDGATRNHITKTITQNAGRTRSVVNTLMEHGLVTQTEGEGRNHLHLTERGQDPQGYADRIKAEAEAAKNASSASEDEADDEVEEEDSDESDEFEPEPVPASSGRSWFGR